MGRSLSLYTAVSGVVLSLVGGLYTLAPDMPGWVIFGTGILLAVAGFWGVTRGIINGATGGQRDPSQGAGRGTRDP